MIALECPMCHQFTEIDVDHYDYLRWRDDPYAPLVQDAFPHLPAADREVLMTGTCITCWDSMFPPEADGV